MSQEYKSDLTGPFIQKNISLALKTIDILKLSIEERYSKRNLNVKENTKIYGRWI